MLDNKQPPVKPAASGVQGAIKRPADGNKTLKKRYSAAETRAVLAELKLGLIDGLSDVELQEQLGVTVGVYNELKRELYRQEKAELTSKSTEDLYLEYMWAQRGVIKEIDDTIIKGVSGEGNKQQNAVIGALRTKSEIIDKILKTGQDMGVINKEPERKMHLHGHVVANMTTAELRQAITKDATQVLSALKKYGANNFADEPIDAKPEVVTPAQLNLQGKQGKAMAGPTKAAAARASRQAVKRTKVIDVG